MADETQKQTATLEELMVSTLAMAGATVKLLIQKGVFTDKEFKLQLGTERRELSRRVEAPTLTIMCGRFGTTFQYRDIKVLWNLRGNLPEFGLATTLPPRKRCR
jgi:hypothetical protein